MQKTKQKKVVAKMIKRKLTKYPINQSIGLEISGFIIKHKTNETNEKKTNMQMMCEKWLIIIIIINRLIVKNQLIRLICKTVVVDEME